MKGNDDPADNPRLAEDHASWVSQGWRSPWRTRRDLRAEAKALECQIDRFLGGFQIRYEWKDSFGSLLIVRRELSERARASKSGRIEQRILASLQKIQEFAARRRDHYCARIRSELDAQVQSLAIASEDVVEHSQHDEWDNDLDVRSSVYELRLEADGWAWISRRTRRGSRRSTER